MTQSGHLFSASHQPATSWVDNSCDPPIKFEYSPMMRLRCYGCRKLRQAQNLTVQVFYDSVRFWCAKGGCKK